MNTTFLITSIYLILFVMLLSLSKANQHQSLLDKYKNQWGVIKATLFNVYLTFALSYTWLHVFVRTRVNSELFSILILMAFILSTQFGVAFITDRIAHEIDRYISRLGYVFMGVAFVRYLEFAPLQATKNQLYLYYTALQIVTIVLMFVLVSIGSADFRILLMTNAVAVSVAHPYLFYFICGNLLTTSIFQYIIQKRAGNNRLPVPIGHVLIGSTLISFLTLSTWI